MIALSPHPSTPADARSISASAARTAAGALDVRYVVQGAVDAIRLPAPGPPHRADRLWEHTCAEAFVAAEGSSAYVEINAAPSRAWAVYGFAGYRERAPAVDIRLAPRIDVRRERDEVVLDVHVALAELSPVYPDAVLRIGLSMVLEASDGRLSYWALHHPRPAPDFHDADGFVLRLERARAADANVQRGSFRGSVR